MSAWNDRLHHAFKETGWSMAELARRSGVGEQNVYKYLRRDGKSPKQPRGDTLKRLAETLGVEELWLRDGDGPMRTKIKVIGYTSGGDTWHPLDDHPIGGDLDTIDFVPPDDDAIALRVRNISMLPVYREGDVLICRRHPALDEAQFLRRDCVVKTIDGGCYIKTVVPGSKKGHYRLRSYNPVEPDREDVQLEWAAPVIWVKRG